MGNKDYETGVMFDADLTGVDFGPGLGPAGDYDECVYLALGSAWARCGNTPFSVSHLTRLMGGLAKASPTAKQRDRVNASVGLLSHGTLNGTPILMLHRTATKFGGLTCEDAIVLDEQPLLLFLEEMAGRVLEVPMEVFADPLSFYGTNIVLRNYALRRIRDAHLSGEKEFFLPWAEVYAVGGAGSAEQRRKARAKVDKLLGYYDACRFVYDVGKADGGLRVTVDPPDGGALYWKEE